MKFCENTLIQTMGCDLQSGLMMISVKTDFE